MTYYGDIDTPGKLDAMLNWSRIGPGDTILLRGGVHVGDFTCTLIGTAENPVIVRSYSGERAIIDGTFKTTGQYCHFVDIEFRRTNWVNRELSTYQIGVGQQFDLNGIGNRAIGCRIHDVFNVGSWQTNQNGGLFDCLVYNIGANYLDGGGHGHCLYNQNEFDGQYHYNNILWGAFNYGFHAYTGGGKIDYIHARRNISFLQASREFALGGLGGQRGHYCTIEENCVYPGDSSYYKGNYGTFTNNYWGGQALGVQMDSVENTFTGDSVAIEPAPIPPAPTSGKEIRVYPREYQTYFPGWAHIAIYNWDQDDSVDVDLSGVTNLAAGDAYRLHNAQDYENDIATGIVPANGIITVDMRATSHTVIPRLGMAVDDPKYSVTKSFPVFGAFVLERVAP